MEFSAAALTWNDFDVELRQSSYEPATFVEWDAPAVPSPFDLLHYWFLAQDKKQSLPKQTSDWLSFSAAAHTKLLRRGIRTFPQDEIGGAILALYSADIVSYVTNDDQENLRDSPETANRDAELTKLRSARSSFTSFTSKFNHTPDYFNPLDPDNPQNEAKLLNVLTELAGERIQAFTHCQFPLDKLMPDGHQKFSSQRADFVIMLPNGKGLVLEPGDHDQTQNALDTMRDQAFIEHFGFKTLRPANKDIETNVFRNELQSLLDEIGALEFTKNPDHEALQLQKTLLTAPLLNRIESLFVETLLGSDLWNHQHVSINIIERDIPVSEIAIHSFILQQQKIHDLYGESYSPPELTFRIYSPSGKTGEKYILPDDLDAGSIHIERYDTQPESKADLNFDISITTGTMHHPIPSAAGGPRWIIRNAPIHHTPTVLPTVDIISHPALDDRFEKNITPFLRDIFRKRSFKSDQCRVIESILSRNDTIALLPTGAGKSICYQLAGIISPGCTLVVSPIIALMEDQAAALNARTRVTACETINSARTTPVTAGEVAHILKTCCYVFVAPERFQRDNFRAVVALQTDPINLVAIDEAHCVSMWGHDFRPSYLRLPANIRNLCSNALGIPPPIVALTGTASQLVLIDLKRILLDEDSDANVIRPETFNRDELTFRVRHCSIGKDTKLNLLKKSVLPEIKKDLGKKKLLQESFGIIFDYAPVKLWTTLSTLDSKSADSIKKFNPKANFSSPLLGLYTGKCPKPIEPDLLNNWDAYKRTIFDAFTRKQLRCLVGNNAVSVGIDHTGIEYVVNMSMPQSLEDYYQQAGRAGRNGQTSYCYLLYSENTPETNDSWFSNQGGCERFSDVDSAAYFHQLNFPGKDDDLRAILKVLVSILKLHSAGQQKNVSLKANSIYGIQPDKVERFVGYLILIGVVHDYTLQGMKQGLIIHITLEDEFDTTLQNGDTDATYQHTLTCLWAYYNRYLPFNKYKLDDEISQLAVQVHGGKLLSALCQHLIEFVYEKIEYQRRNSIKLITDYCREAVDDEGKAKQIIRDTFDKSRFSDRLFKMRTHEPSLDDVAILLNDISDKAEAEQLIWETGRLLSEVDRGVWRLIRSIARLIANNSKETETREATNVTEFAERYGEDFFQKSIHCIHRSHDKLGKDTHDYLIHKCLLEAYQTAKTKPMVIRIISHATFPKGDLLNRISMIITNDQLKQINELLRNNQ